MVHVSVRDWDEVGGISRLVMYLFISVRDRGIVSRKVNEGFHLLCP